MKNDILRVAVFMDGNYFSKVNEYYRFCHHAKRNINLPGLFEFIREKVSFFEEINKKYCQVVENHWFRGRFTTSNMEQKYQDDLRRLTQLTHERKMSDIFMHMGIVQHVFPMQINPVTGEAHEKGIDVWLSLEAFELAYLKKFDVLVLVAGDSDYVPLVRKLNGIGTRVLVLGWELDAEGGNRPVRTSQSLLDECSYPLIMNTIIDDKTNKNNAIVQAIFGQ